MNYRTTHHPTPTLFGVSIGCIMAVVKVVQVTFDGSWDAEWEVGGG